MREAAGSRYRPPWWAWLVCTAVFLVAAFALLNAVVSLAFESVGGLPYGSSPPWYVPALRAGVVASVVVPVVVCRVLLRSWRPVAVAVEVVAGLAAALRRVASLAKK